MGRRRARRGVGRLLVEVDDGGLVEVGIRVADRSGGEETSVIELEMEK